MGMYTRMLGYIYVRLYLYTLQFAHKLITCYDCFQYVVSLFRFVSFPTGTYSNYAKA